MKHFIFLLTLVVFINTNAQYKQANYFEANVAFAKNKYDFNLNWHHLHPISKNKKLKFGYGLRFTSFFGDGLQTYSSAPAIIAKNTSGPAVLFTKTIENNLDYVRLNNPTMAFLNTYIILQYTFFDKLDIGFNIDVIGFGFGLKNNGVYGNDQGFIISTPVNPSQSNFNLLLIDVNDRGSLNSELFVRYWFSKKWAAKLAVSHLFTEITTDEKVQKIPQENDRFRLVSNLVSVGVTFKPWE